MAKSRRAALDGVRIEQAEHAGLWFDRYLDDAAGPEAATKRTLVDHTARVPEPPAWRTHSARWTQTLTTLGAQTRLMRVNGRLIVGLGGESVIETAITLHRTYGVPVIPGSALKGLAAAYARQRLDVTNWQRGTDAYRTMFGDSEAAGYVTFYDALYLPDSGWDRRPLHADVITVHHPDYYQTGNAPPADWDSPNPIPFLTATGSYLLAAGGPPDWANAALSILVAALHEWGVGAKTSAGYGRLAPAQGSASVI